MAEQGEINQQQNEMTQQEEEKNLKYLEFVQAATVNIVGCLSTAYDYAKDNSGPLKPSVQTIEGTVKTVVAPVYHKFHDVPYGVLKFVDAKVDVSVTEVERRVPSVVKVASSKAISVAQKTPEVARALASEIQRAGVVGSATGVAKNAYTMYEPIAEGYAVTAWRKLNTLPVFPKVANVIVPTAGYCSERYNDAVCYTADKGYAVSSYLPLVPTKRIAEVFGEEAVKPAPTVRTVSVE